MKECIESKITRILVETKHIAPKDRKLYEYALKILLRSGIGFLIVILTGLFMNHLKESVCVFLSFFILRKFSGGYHLKKYLSCFCSSLLITITELILIMNKWFVPKCVFLTVVAIAAVATILFSPVEHPDKKLFDREKQIYKTISVILTILICLICSICICFESTESLSYSFGTGLSVSSSLLLLGEVKYKKTKTKSNQT